MFNKIFTLLLTATISLTIFNACENSTNPPAPAKSLLDYTWTVDTLNVPGAFQNLMRSMYAANAEDIYLVGHNSGSHLSNGNGGMWHYDGNEWSIVKLREEIGPFGTLSSIHGSSRNNVWAVGGSFEYATLLQYNGMNWKKHLAETSDGRSGTPISKNVVYSVFAESETDVWACGDGGLVYHFDGNIWDIDTIKVELKDDENFQLRNVIVNNNDVYIHGVKVIGHGAELVFYFYKKVNDSWKIIENFTFNHDNLNMKWGTYRLVTSPNNIIYSSGIEGIFKWNDTYWNQILAVDYSISGIHVKTEDNILAVGTNSVAYHFNGSNWEELNLPIESDIYLNGAWMGNNSTLIIGNTLNASPQQTVVIHGK